MRICLTAWLGGKATQQSPDVYWLAGELGELKEKIPSL